MVYFDDYGNEYSNVEEFIGKSYYQWVYDNSVNVNKVVYIQTPTGSGKSYFVYRNLLEYAVMHGEKILYLVNRKILKKQLKIEAEAALSDIRVRRNIYDAMEYIQVSTYQYLENLFADRGLEWGVNYLGRFNYIIMDEAHYFLQDSTYNTYNIWSFDVIMRCHSSVRVFMSATMSEVVEYYTKTYKQYLAAEQYKITEALEPKEYRLHMKYDYIKPNFFGDYVEIINRILDDKKNIKWLVIVDTKESGKSLAKGIKSEVQERNSKIKEQNKKLGYKEKEEIVCDTVFIDAAYERDSEALVSVSEVIMENAMKAKVVIATIVLDNGISIKDEDLRKLVVVTDSKAELLQIIGRKRIVEGETIELFLSKGKRDMFKQRLKKVESCLRVAEEIESCMRQYGTTLETVILKLLASEVYYDLCKKFLFYDKDIRELRVNPLSKTQLLRMRENYINILNEFDLNHELGFFNLQLKWLGLYAEDEMEKYTTDLQMQLRKKVMSSLDSLVDKPLNRNEAMDKKETYRKELHSLLERYCIDNPLCTNETKKLLDDLYRSKQAIPKKKFNEIMRTLELPYRMEVRREKRKYLYTIKKS